jgi:Glucan phosphorylase
MMQKYFGKFAKELNVPFEELFSFGHTRLNPDEPFSMTILALRLSRHANGVSKLHGEVSRSLWKDVWSGVPMHEVPITSITNGVHTKTWMAPEFAALYRKHLGDWEEHLTEPDFWRGVIDIPTRNCGRRINNLNAASSILFATASDNAANDWANRRSRFAGLIVSLIRKF